MKHLLNNLTESEKESILKQHTGGMKVVNERFNRLLESKMGNVKPLINEDEGKEDYDHFGKIVIPRMKTAGFKYVKESPLPGQPPYGVGYFTYPEHNNGVNLFLDTMSGNWKYVVFTHPGNKNLKEFGWKIGTNDEVIKAANDAVNYAISLKDRFYSKDKSTNTVNTPLSSN